MLVSGSVDFFDLFGGVNLHEYNQSPDVIPSEFVYPKSGIIGK